MANPTQQRISNGYRTKILTHLATTRHTWLTAYQLCRIITGSYGSVPTIKRLLSELSDTAQVEKRMRADKAVEWRLS